MNMCLFVSECEKKTDGNQPLWKWNFEYNNNNMKKIEDRFWAQF